MYSARYTSTLNLKMRTNKANLSQIGSAISVQRFVEGKLSKKLFALTLLSISFITSAAVLRNDGKLIKVAGTGATNALKTRSK